MRKPKFLLRYQVFFARNLFHNKGIICNNKLIANEAKKSKNTLDYPSMRAKQEQFNKKYKTKTQLKNAKFSIFEPKAEQLAGLLVTA